MVLQVIAMLVFLNLALAKRQQKAKLEKPALTGDDVREALVEGALLRLRPKLMTVFAIIGGLLPIMLFSGTGSEVMRRIAVPMMGGIGSLP
ncbi:efflux RND transporter permease subunit [Legionella londiniensis]|uniref:Cation efflux system protein cusA n=1 Tax=Legionella londiniensis TaxID=45068 RepID=A0A0W0VM71_9GAMM|nr:efflux RND transporter permease subunit [Legionella londiniensis]KTD21223.1 Cation efflux system protein cusA [Legionella londiniensis]STX93248.1 Cation efflux system protein cusA [Legionella londiniensis]